MILADWSWTICRLGPGPPLSARSSDLMTSGYVPDPALKNQPFSRQQWLVILAVTLLAALLRMLELGEWSFWIDEAHTWRDATMPLAGDSGFMSTDRRMYSLPFFLLRFLFGVGALGFDEWSVRLPFALIGIATVPLLAVCGRRLVGPWPAVFAACLLAVSPWHIFWSQNARGYVMVVLGSVLLMHRLHVLLQTGRARDLLLSGLFAAFAMGSHATAATLVLAFVGFLVVRSANRTRFGGLTVVVLALLLAGPVPWLVKHYGLFAKFFEAKSNTSPLHWFETVVYYFRPSLLLTVLLAMLAAPRLLGRTRALYLGCMLVVPMFALTAVGSQLAKVTARYAICTLPAAMLLAGFLIAVVTRRIGQLPGLSKSRRWLLAGVLPALVVGDFLQLDVAYFTQQHGQRGQWRAASQFVREQAQERGRSGARVLSVNHPTMLYYLRPRHWFVGDQDPHPEMDVSAVLFWRFSKGEDNDENKLHEPGVEAHFQWHLKRAARNDQMFAVVITLPALREKDKTGQFEAVLKRDFELALYLPTWVGPKDESIYVYLPRRTE
ncbi:MAG: mannosyltransferase [Hyphomicrobiaceae bacterium]|jgi:mannosyltransferase